MWINLLGKAQHIRIFMFHNFIHKRITMVDAITHFVDVN